MVFNQHGGFLCKVTLQSGKETRLASSVRTNNGKGVHSFMVARNNIPPNIFRIWSYDILEIIRYAVFNIN